MKRISRAKTIEHISKSDENYKKRIRKEFFKKVLKSDNCWIWNGETSLGYGVLYTHSIAIKAHRISYYLHFRKDPGKKLVCHTCDNKKCVNPKHLFLGSHRDNAVDMVKKGRACILLGEDNRQAKLTERKIIKMIKLVSKGNRPSDLAAKFGVNKNTLYYILNRQSWTKVTSVQQALDRLYAGEE